MGQIIEWNGRQREVVKIKSDNPTHHGYYTTFRDQMQPGDVEYQEPGTEDRKPDPATQLTVAQIKEKLAELAVDIPEGVTKKADLQALLDGAEAPKE